MHGILPEHLGIERPVLHQLRGQLHEIALDLRESAVLHVVEQEVERMPELVEQRLGLVEGQQRGIAPRRAREVADDRHHGRHALPVLVGLLHVVAAPRALALSVAREVIEIEHAQMRLVDVEHLVSDRLGVVQRHDDRAERDAVEPVGEEEDASLHVLQREIGPQHLLVEGIFLLADLLGVIPPVPRRELSLGEILPEQLLHLGQLALGAFERRGPDLLQQAVHGVGRSGHLVVHDVGGIRGIAQQVGLLRAQADEIVDQLFVVILVAVVAAVEVGLVDLLAQFAFRRVGQKRDQAGLVQRKDVFALPAHRLGLFAGQIADRGRDAVQIGRGEFQRIVVVLGEEVLPELHGRERQFLVDRLQTRLPLGVEQRSGAHETAVGLLQQTALLGVESQRGATVVDSFDPFEKFPVETDLVGVRRHPGHNLLLQRLHFGGVLRGAEHPEDQLDLRKHLSRSVVGEDDVLERRRVIVRRDGVDLGLVQRHAAFDRGQEVLRFDLVEGRHAVWGLPFGEKRIFAHGFPGLAGYECHSQKKC